MNTAVATKMPQLANWRQKNTTSGPRSSTSLRIGIELRSCGHEVELRIGSCHASACRSASCGRSVRPCSCAD